MTYSLENGKIKDDKRNNNEKMDIESLLNSKSVSRVMNELMGTIRTCFGAISKSFSLGFGEHSMDYFKDKIINDCNIGNFSNKYGEKIQAANVIMKDGEVVAYDEYGNKIYGEPGSIIIDSLGRYPSYNIYVFKDNNKIIIPEENSNMAKHDEINSPKKFQKRRYDIMKGTLTL